MLYISMSNKKNYSRINFMKFINIFEELFDEIKKIRNRCVFDIYDIKK